MTSILLSAAAFLALSASAQESTSPLQDIDETFVVSIKVQYPPGIQQHPELARQLAEETADDRAYYIKNRPSDYDMRYALVAQTPEIVAVFGQGSAYEGGAHHNIMLSSHIWLPTQHTWLTAENLMAGADGWQAVSDYVRDKLIEQQLPRKVDDAWMENARDWIRRGTSADNLDNFQYFQPLLADDGKIAALKFVFPPYQVASWADGIQEVDVPASVFIPYLAEPYRALFVRPQ